MGLCEDAESGELAAVRTRILEGGEDVDTMRDGESPLFCAATGGHSEVCDFLLSKGADVNLEDSYGDAPINRGVSYPSVLAVMIAHGCDLEHKDSEGSYPLHNAVQAGCAESVKLLLDKGVRPDLVGEGMGYTALHEAAMIDRVDVAKVLIAGPCNLRFCKRYGW
jgi:ankyrin repeat protein